jgi:hypothetical protein
MAIKRTTRTKSKTLSTYRACHKRRDDDKDCTHELTRGGDDATVTMALCPKCHRAEAEFNKIYTMESDGPL